MELLLNAVWLLLSMATVGVLLRHCLRTHGRLALRGIVVTACALVLLFPVISITDDLHAEQMPMEDASATSKKLLKAADLTAVRLSVHPVYATIGALVSPEPCWLASGVVNAEIPRAAALGVVSRQSGRAPPSLLYS
jgi:hypothetical protein